jgi:hypothetical protein
MIYAKDESILILTYSIWKQDKHGHAIAYKHDKETNYTIETRNPQRIYKLVNLWIRDEGCVMMWIMDNELESYLMLTMAETYEGFGFLIGR